MKKIMFNDKYGLTEAVLSGKKTVTRRIKKSEKPPYKVGEIVAVAQSYLQAWNHVKYPGDWAMDNNIHIELKGYNNKMFVKADLMPHQIKITDVRAKRLQDITDEDCLNEGLEIVDYYENIWSTTTTRGYKVHSRVYDTPREAFASLIDKISGKGTWNSNPFVWRVEFKLI